MVLTTKKKNSTAKSCPSTEEEESADPRDDREQAAASGDKKDDSSDVDDDDDGASGQQGLDDDFTEAGGSVDEGYSNATDDNALDIMMNKKENRWVLRSRTLVLVILLLTALGFAIGAVFIVKNQQQAAFEAS
jgi:hypothetical protein